MKGKEELSTTSTGIEKKQHTITSDCYLWEGPPEPTPLCMNWIHDHSHFHNATASEGSAMAITMFVDRNQTIFGWQTIVYDLGLSVSYKSWFVN